MLGEGSVSMSWQRGPVIQENTVGPQKRNIVALSQAVGQRHLHSFHSLILMLCLIMYQETAFLVSHFFPPISFVFYVQGGTSEL